MSREYDVICACIVIFDGPMSPLMSNARSRSSPSSARVIVTSPFLKPAGTLALPLEGLCDVP
jgi:hypothetical protein